ncbi:MAG TPA: acetyl-CoA carboxylase carboxyltransferase subunit alpha [Armatimonadota bacterium]|nr:acetyl-CoA carboxylase carboxyltransferase subunit alpha [Armatimonadota bacterium]HOJ20475.1 acetyl-CoA carboxylase carboxyltransferase subunit alpha [Armatimonadota bacterium]HOM81088.1 acetyl-CoA carboxylase carboxyltransferase subunit alpha [Armatimonadota bacterium]HPO71358.1 acetyl-CoA carboxylase carboxyltransferase subunit alpha [Armatimonadota bacterium]HPT97300.1 acetyl-CoA carboxylase carboxyltransferase subunit alpha [Armatimonadota bacterium]
MATIRNLLDFEKPLHELEEQVQELKRFTAAQGIDRSQEIAALESQLRAVTKRIYSQLAPWDKVQLARHPARPYTLDFIRMIFDDFLELHGDRTYGDDPAIVGGLAVLNGEPVMVIGHQKGRDIKERSLRNFGSARPEGYRKAVRLLKLAQKTGRPVVSFVDTPAADCSVGAEERGISEAIARSMMEMSGIRVPVVVAITGEGGSGGAIATAVGDRILMLEHAIYSVIPPEGCAAILWRDPSKAPQAAAALKLTAKDVHRLGIVDRVIPEPLGGAHRDASGAAQLLKQAIVESMDELRGLSPNELLERRYKKFRNMGRYLEMAG